ncbi:hypothetical protein PC119_g5857 [Phytophthora cactorum]|uniref:Uncharacterized protein n=1 Tax=Phytophthora cactorum TaxID=29920 RepID=A0A8T1E9H3_9STRA|nr:hypothetical protein PC117_g6224 [Phytophthora cactorum]KAG3031735.1 hypothetical protein PC119_g5857 [Phytophthora cactorum]
MARRGRRSDVSRFLERGNTVVEFRDLRSKCHLDVRCSRRSLRILVAQLMLQLSELPALELFQSGYTVV